MEIDKQKRDRMLALVRQYHSTQMRNNGRIPYWHHCLSVAEILDHAFLRSNEMHDGEMLTDLYLAALGHDLYEDTSISPDLIETKFGQRVNDLIGWMTNEDGDAYRAHYIRKIQSSPEEVKLIKFADLIDNTASCAYGVHDLGSEWIRRNYMPHVVEMKQVLCLPDFTRYPYTAQILSDQLDFVFHRMLNNLPKFD